MTGDGKEKLEVKLRRSRGARLPRDIQISSLSCPLLLAPDMEPFGLWGGLR